MSERDLDRPAPLLVHVDEVPSAPVRDEEGWHGLDIRFLVGEERGGVRSACLFRTLFPAGAAHRPHRHPRADEVLYVVRGRATVGAEGEETGGVGGAYLGVGSLAEAGYEPVPEVEG